ncbi:MutS-related protein [Marinifilum sp. RC60d5]|uniref:MutS-related protein n=1 Tax=Marinifilum sp. RC60d5 TaxID=3458414 RepID=UPI004036009D
MMEFVTDQQTLDDLNLLGRYKNNSIFSLFNHTITIGGGRLLEKMFHEPLTNIESINSRKNIFSFFEEQNISLPFEGKEFELVENYLRNSESKNRALAAFNITRSKVLNFIANEDEYLVFFEGLEETINLLYKLNGMITKLLAVSSNNAYTTKALEISGLLNNRLLVQMYDYRAEGSLKFKDVLKFDYILRALLSEELEQLLKEIFELDVYIAVSNVSRENAYVYAEAVKKQDKFIDIKAVYHPSVPNAIANDVFIDGAKNVFFLTGANMAGKSTFMKSFAVAVYMAHMGFPVAAKEMTFSLHDGIYTSINVPDNIDLGLSHFYAEVLRVKKIAEEVASDKQLLIIFDELFKGTNVKDAYDGTVSIVNAFSKRNGIYIVSTHIMEAGETLRSNKRIFFRYLPTVMKGNLPTYPYILEDGITDDRQGMIIIKNEKILDIINSN